MARPPRQNEPGDTHHVIARGVARGVIAVDAEDYRRMLRLLAKAASRFDLRVHAWCFLPNHFHLLVSSPPGNLSDAMRWYGGSVAQSINRRHDRVGPLFQGRFGSRLVESREHLLEVARYIPLNPVKAHLCPTPDGWWWSSYAATVGLTPKPGFLDPSVFLAEFRSLGQFVEWVVEDAASRFLDDSGEPLRPPLADLVADPSDEAVADAHFTHGYNISEISEHLGTSRSRISRRLVSRAGFHGGSDARIGPC
jgi:putative transposase